MKKALIGLATAIGIALAPAAETGAYNPSYTLSWDEYAPLSSVTFTPASCTPGPGCDPRGAGSWFTSFAPLTRGATTVGSVAVYCLTTHTVARPDLPPVVTPFGTFPAVDYWGDCSQKLWIGNESITARGIINETGLERYEPQLLRITEVSSGFRAPVDLIEHWAYLKVQQTQYPDRFELTVLTPYTANGHIPGF